MTLFKPLIDMHVTDTVAHCYDIPLHTVGRHARGRCSPILADFDPLCITITVSSAYIIVVVLYQDSGIQEI